MRIGTYEFAALIRRRSAHFIRARDSLSHQQAGCIAAFSSCEHQKKFPLACRGVHVYAHYAAVQ
jgi:hypothetical protein